MSTRIKGEESGMGHHPSFEEQINTPITANVHRTRDNDDFLVYDQKVTEADSDDDDLDRFVDVGLREQLFVTLSRQLKSLNTKHDKITERTLADSIKMVKRKIVKKKVNSKKKPETTKAGTASKRTSLEFAKREFSNLNKLKGNGNSNNVNNNGKSNSKNDRKEKGFHSFGLSQISENHKSIVTNENDSNIQIINTGQTKPIITEATANSRDSIVIERIHNSNDIKNDKNDNEMKDDNDRKRRPLPPLPSMTTSRTVNAVGSANTAQQIDFENVLRASVKGARLNPNQIRQMLDDHKTHHLTQNSNSNSNSSSDSDELNTERQIARMQSFDFAGDSSDRNKNKNKLLENKRDQKRATVEIKRHKKKNGHVSSCHVSSSATGSNVVTKVKSSKKKTSNDNNNNNNNTNNNSKNNNEDIPPPPPPPLPPAQTSETNFGFKSPTLEAMLSPNGSDESKNLGNKTTPKSKTPKYDHSPPLNNGIFEVGYKKLEEKRRNSSNAHDEFIGKTKEEIARIKHKALKQQSYKAVEYYPIASRRDGRRDNKHNSKHSKRSSAHHTSSKSRPSHRSSKSGNDKNGATASSKRHSGKHRSQHKASTKKHGNIPPPPPISDLDMELVRVQSRSDSKFKNNLHGHSNSHHNTHSSTNISINGQKLNDTSGNYGNKNGSKKKGFHSAHNSHLASASTNKKHQQQQQQQQQHHHGFQNSDKSIQLYPSLVNDNSSNFSADDSFDDSLSLNSDNNNSNHSRQNVGNLLGQDKSSTNKKNGSRPQSTRSNDEPANLHSNMDVNGHARHFTTDQTNTSHSKKGATKHKSKKKNENKSGFGQKFGQFYDASMEIDENSSDDEKAHTIKDIEKKKTSSKTKKIPKLQLSVSDDDNDNTNATDDLTSDIPTDSQTMWAYVSASEIHLGDNITKRPKKASDIISVSRLSKIDSNSSTKGNNGYNNNNNNNNDNDDDNSSDHSHESGKKKSKKKTKSSDEHVNILRPRGATWLGKSSHIPLSPKYDKSNGIGSNSKQPNVIASKTPHLSTENNMAHTSSGSITPSSTGSNNDALSRVSDTVLLNNKQQFKNVEFNDSSITFKKQDARMTAIYGYHHFDGGGGVSNLLNSNDGSNGIVDDVASSTQKDILDFEHIHHKIARELTEQVFDGCLKSWQRAFAPVTPQHLGLHDFGLIRHRRRAVFGDEDEHTEFHDTQSSCMSETSLTDLKRMLRDYFKYETEWKHSKSKSKGHKNAIKNSQSHSVLPKAKDLNSPPSESTTLIPHARTQIFPEHSKTRSIISPSNTTFVVSPFTPHSKSHTMKHLKFDNNDDLDSKNDNNNNNNNDANGMDTKDVDSKDKRAAWKRMFGFKNKSKKKNKMSKHNKSNSAFIGNSPSFSSKVSVVVGNNNNNNKKSKLQNDSNSKMFGQNIDVNDNEASAIGSITRNGIGGASSQDDTFFAMSEDHSPTYSESVQRFELKDVKDEIEFSKLKRGDLMFVLDYEMIDEKTMNFDEFLDKYNINEKNFKDKMQTEFHQHVTNKLESLNAEWNALYDENENDNDNDNDNDNENDDLRRRNSRSESIDSDNQSTRVRLNTVVRKDTGLDNGNNTNGAGFLSPSYETVETPFDIGIGSPRTDATLSSLGSPMTITNILSSSGKTPKNTFDENKRNKSIFEEWSETGAIHAMIVLQNIGSTIEIAHVTTYGGCKSFVRAFDAEKIAETIYKRILLCETDDNGIRKSIVITQENKKTVFDRENIYKSTHNLLEDSSNGNSNSKKNGNNKNKKNSRGPPVVYRCFVYRLQSSHAQAKTLATEAANVAENLVSTGRVLADVSIFAGSSQRYMVENPESSFDRYLLNDKTSLFRRPVRQEFDDGTHFFNFSPSEFIINCYQRAIVNRKSFNKQLLRILDCDPYITPSPLLQKYIHVNITQYHDWTCLGKLFLQFL